MNVYEDPYNVHIGIGSTIYTWEYENAFLLDKDYFVQQTETCLPVWKLRPASKEMNIDSTKMERHGILMYVNYKDPIEYSDPVTNEKEYISVWGIIQEPPYHMTGHPSQTWAKGVIYAPYIPLVMTPLPTGSGFTKRFGIKGLTKP